MAAASNVECGDFLEFQDALQKMRQIDDKIIYLLNTTIPTESFKGQIDPKVKCENLFQQIRTGHFQRDGVINKCLNATREKINQLKVEKNHRPEDITVLKALSKEQTVLRLLESELGVEEIVKNRTNKIYLAKCRQFYKPNKLSS